MQNSGTSSLVLIGLLVYACTGAPGQAAPPLKRGYRPVGNYRVESRSARPWVQRSGSGVRARKNMPWREKTWESVTYVPRDPRSICSAVKRRVMFVRDRGPTDDWKSAQDTWSEKAGDCEDFAVLVQRLCEKGNIRSAVYCFYPPTGSGHAVTLGEWRGQRWMSSNGSFTEVRSINDAKRKIAHSQGWAAHSVRVSKGEKPLRATTSGGAAR